MRNLFIFVRMFVEIMNFCEDGKVFIDREVELVKLKAWFSDWKPLGFRVEKRFLGGAIIGLSKGVKIGDMSFNFPSFSRF